MWRGGRCPTVLGLWLACLVFLAACGDATTAPSSEFVPESPSDAVEQVPPTITEDRQTHLTLRIEDESGELVSTGEVELIDRSTDWASGEESVLEGIARWGRFVDPIHGDLSTYDLRDGNPLEVWEIEPEFHGLVFDVKVHVRGRSPVLSESVVIREGKHVQRRIVVPSARSVTVRVLDAAGGAVVGARVTSVTECRRRGWSVEEVLDEPGYGSGLTGADGRVEIDGLGAGEHEFVVRGADRRLTTVRSSRDEVTAILPQSVETGRARVFVRGEDGRGVAGVNVECIISHTTRTTDVDGVAVFERLPVGPTAFSFDVESFRRAGGTPDIGPGLRIVASADVRAGRETVLLLGAEPPGDGRLAVLVAGADGKGRAGLDVTVTRAGGGGPIETTTDAEGRAVADTLRAGFYGVTVRVSDEAELDLRTELSEDSPTSLRLQLGDHALRGSLDLGSSPTTAEQCRVRFRGPVEGYARVRTSGDFEVPSLPPGRYEVEARSGRGIPSAYRAPPVEIDLPMEGELRLALHPTGSVGVRFSKADRDVLEKCLVLLADDAGEFIAGPSGGTAEEFDVEFVDVVEGTYQVLVQRSRLNRELTPIEVRGGQRTLVDVDAP